MSFGITALFYVLMLQTAVKQRWESEGIGITCPNVLPRKCTYTIPAPPSREAGCFSYYSQLSQSDSVVRVKGTQFPCGAWDWSYAPAVRDSA